MSAAGTPGRGASGHIAAHTQSSATLRPRSSAKAQFLKHVQLGLPREDDSELVTRRLKAAYGY